MTADSGRLIFRALPWLRSSITNGGAARSGEDVAYGWTPGGSNSPSPIFAHRDGSGAVSGRNALPSCPLWFRVTTEGASGNISSPASMRAMVLSASGSSPCL